MFPYEKYKYFTNGVDLVVAESTYAGKKYRGKAHLGDGDEFDYEKGKKLAAARCDKIICKKRCIYALQKMKVYDELIQSAQEDLDKEKEFFKDALSEFVLSMNRLSEIEESLGFIKEGNQE